MAHAPLALEGSFVHGNSATLDEAFYIDNRARLNITNSSSRMGTVRCPIQPKCMRRSFACNETTILTVSSANTHDHRRQHSGTSRSGIYLLSGAAVSGKRALVIRTTQPQCLKEVVPKKRGLKLQDPWNRTRDDRGNTTGQTGGRYSIQWCRCVD